MVKNVLYDQVISFSVALIVILLLIGLILRSVKMVLIALPCNAIPIAIIFGFMGYRGIRLDIATVTIAAAVIGIIVDDTIHILYNLKCNLQTGSSFSDSIQEVAKQTGLAVLSTSIILASGFIVIAFSGIKSIAYTGLLTAIAVGAALIADLILLPAIAHFYYGKK
jgi:predicted RND superfamily exporter protein